MENKTRKYYYGNLLSESGFIMITYFDNGKYNLKQFTIDRINVPILIDKVNGKIRTIKNPKISYNAFSVKNGQRKELDFDLTPFNNYICKGIENLINGVKSNFNETAIMWEYITLGPKKFCITSRSNFNINFGSHINACISVFGSSDSEYSDDELSEIYKITDQIQPNLPFEEF